MHLRVLALLLAAAACASRTPSSPLHPVGLTFVEKAAGVEEVGGLIVNIETGRPMPDTMLALSHVRLGSAHALWLEQLVPVAGSPRPRSTVLATQALPSPAPGEFIALAECIVNGQPDPTVAALVYIPPGEREGRTRRAWQVDTVARAFRDIAPNGVDCVDEEYEA